MNKLAYLTINVYKRKGETNTEGWMQLLSKTLNSNITYILAMSLSQVWIKAKQIAFLYNRKLVKFLITSQILPDIFGNF